MAVVYFVADELFRDHASEPEPRAKGRKNALIPDKGGVKTMAIHRMPAGRDWMHNFAVGNIKNAQDADISPYVFKREHRIFRRCKCEVTDCPSRQFFAIFSESNPLDLGSTPINADQHKRKLLT